MDGDQDDNGDHRIGGRALLHVIKTGMMMSLSLMVIIGWMILLFH